MRCAWLLLLILGLCSSLTAGPRTDYRAVDGVYADGRRAWRAWSDALGPHLLVVAPETLETSVVPGDPSSLQPRSPGDSPLDRLAAAAGHRGSLQNAGLRRLDPGRPGAWLTFDLCPSSRPLDRGIFQELEADQRPLPVMLEVSGLWMRSHADDLAWLQGESGAGRLEITWVNHTENHRYVRNAPLGKNFLLLPDTDLDQEVFALEERLLDAGIVPSVFFRFPGLVSSRRLVDQVLALGLVPLGASAWLAKQQAVAPGAIVLTHANGNEPEGLKLLEAWDQDNRALIQAGEFHWLGRADWISAGRPSTGSRVGS